MDDPGCSERLGGRPDDGIENRGLGVVAQNWIRCGERILAESPLLVCSKQHDSVRDEHISTVIHGLACCASAPDKASMSGTAGSRRGGRGGRGSRGGRGTGRGGRGIGTVHSMPRAIAALAMRHTLMAASGADEIRAAIVTALELDEPSLLRPIDAAYVRLELSMLAKRGPQETVAQIARSQMRLDPDLLIDGAPPSTAFAAAQSSEAPASLAAASSASLLAPPCTLPLSRPPPSLPPSDALTTLGGHAASSGKWPPLLMPSSPRPPPPRPPPSQAPPVFCLSLMQPYAGLLLNGYKTLETRSGSECARMLVKLEGRPLYLHVGRKPWPVTRGGTSAWFACVPPAARVPSRAAAPTHLGDVRGCIAGVMIVGATHPTEVWAERFGWTRVEELALVPRQMIPRFATAVSSARWLRAPIPHVPTGGGVYQLLELNQMRVLATL